MPGIHNTSKTERIPAVELAEQFARVPVLATVSPDDLRSLGEIEVIRAGTGEDLVSLAGHRSVFWVVFEGSLRVVIEQEDGSFLPFAILKAGNTGGEVPLLMGKEPRGVLLALEPSVVAALSEDAFWQLMFCCPEVRRAVLGDMAQRLEAYRNETLHREKLIALGALTAGLMHELNNPGAAARRAAAALRENLTQVQRISLQMCKGERKTEAQVDCMHRLQQQVLESKCQVAKDTLAQADAEEKLAGWLEQQGIDNSWKLAPVLSAIGIDREILGRAQQEFPGSTLSDPLNWVGALVSSVELVSTVEESISRMTDLIRAVKKFSYDEKTERRPIDLHDGIQGTLLILGHKLRAKELKVETRFSQDLPPFMSRGRGLSQVWTNLLDNAIDAAPQRGRIGIRTAVNGASVWVTIEDNGPGIPPESRDRIFEPFFTTKEAGRGSGLGLDIAQRIVTGQFGGSIEVQSEPGRTEFRVILPVEIEERRADA